MNKDEEKKLTKLIKEEIKKVSSYSNEHLVHIIKIISSKQSKREKTLYEPLLKAIEKERKSRGTKEIDSKIVPIGTKGKAKEKK